MITPISPPQRRLLSYKQAAEYLSIGERKLRMLANEDGEFAPIIIGARRLIDVSDLDAYVERQKRRSA